MPAASSQASKQQQQQQQQPASQPTNNNKKWRGGQALWPWDGHYKSILLPADEEIIGSS
jgi:hypothetical protein